MGLLSPLWSGLRNLKQRYWHFRKTLPDGNSIVFRDVDRCIIDEVYAGKAYGDASDIPEGGVVVDAGGHIGAFALWAAKRVGPKGRVIAFEPAPENLALLRRNVAANDLRQAEVLPYALSNREGEAKLFIAPSYGNPAANTLMGDGSRAVTVVLRRLDDVVRERKISRIDLLKIDVEGAELQLLEGAAEALKVTRRIVMEAHPEKLDPEQVLKALSAAGFSPKILSKKEHSWLIDARRSSGPQA